MSVAMAWILVALSGCGFFFWSRRVVPNDAVAVRVLQQSQESVRGGAEARNPKKAIDAMRFYAWTVGALLFALAGVALQHGFAKRTFVFSILGAGLGELYHRGRKDRLTKLFIQRLEFSLPMAMERMVMAVGSGLDIIPALVEAARKSTDPVSDIFRRIVALSESGLRVEQAIALVAEEVPSSAVKHALVHLGLAYKQGGEVVRPLKELSDATQTQYQETVEEEISKLPVKAVVPLVLTFTGLIVCFLTVPIVQVRTSLEKFADVAR